MKIIKNIFITGLLAVLTISTKGQQLPQFSQFMYNDFVLNPGVTGIRDKSEIRLVYRDQWAGFTDAPVTQTLSFNTPLGVSNGLGVYIFNDVTGPTRQTGGTISFAHHVKVTNTGKLSFGLDGKLFQYSLDMTKLKLRDAGADKVFVGGNTVLIVPDASFGMFYKGRSGYIGASLPHLIETKTNFNDYSLSQAKLARHFFFMIGNDFKLNEKIEVEPSVFIKAVKGAPVQLDFNTKLIFSKNYWLGASYRTGDAAVFMVGIKLDNGLSFGYSYDYILSDISKVSTSSSEFVLGFDFGGNGQAGAERRNNDRLMERAKTKEERKKKGRNQDEVK